MRKWILLTATTALFALTVFVHAQPQAQRQVRGGGERLSPLERLVANQELIEDLGLDEEQVEALKEAQTEAKKATIELRARQELAQVDLKAELEAEAPDTEKAMAAIEQAGHARIEMQKLRVRAMLQAREILGPETWQELQEVRKERAAEFAEVRRERMGEIGERARRGRAGNLERPRRNARPFPGDEPRPEE